MTEEELFAEAVKLPPAERTPYLARACGNNTLLRTQVEELLRAHDQPDSLLEAPCVDLSFDLSQSPVEGEGTTVGPYKLLQQIGEGGMGIVYMAKQTTPVRRKVALKIIKPGMDTRQVVARFEAERQALAMMDHPHIAKVYDGGATELGRPYFVMELVRGVPITDYCDQKSLTTRERMQLFSCVCRAVQHAHQRAIIHRDLKPSNILVTQIDGQAVVKIIDFGIAKTLGEALTDKTLFTRFAEFLGTPLYMSPEQAEMSGQDVDTRTDVYSLGVVLYELLTGHTPFDRERMKGTSYEGMRRIIREEDPPRPSTRVSTLDAKQMSTVSQRRGNDARRLIESLRHELDWIVMRALEKDRNRRYESASAFADDVDRYLRNEPIVACPPSRVYQFRKFVRRNQTAIVTSCLLSLTLLVGIAVSGWQAYEASTARATAEDNLREVDKQRRQAERNLRDARQAIDRYFTLVSESTLLEEPGLLPLRLELIRNAAEFYDQLASREASDPETRFDLAMTHLRLGQIEYGLSQMHDSITALDKGFALIESLMQQWPAHSKNYEKLAGFWHVTQSDIVTEYQPIGSFEEASIVLQHGIDLWETLARSHPNVPGFASDLSKFYDFLEDQKRAMGKLAEARELLRKVRDIRERLVKEYPENREFKAELAYAYWTFADLPETPPSEARELNRQGFRLHQESNLPIYRIHLVYRHRSFAKFLEEQKYDSEAIDQLDAAIAILDELMARAPHIKTYPELKTSLCFEKAKIYQRTENRTGEEQALRVALETSEKLPKTPSGVFSYAPSIYEIQKSLQSLLLAQGRAEETLQLKWSPKNAHDHFIVGRALLEDGHLAEAEDQFKKALALDSHQEDTLVSLGVLRIRQRSWEEAVSYLTQAVQVNPKNSWARNNLCQALLGLDNIDEAIAESRRAIENNPLDGFSHSWLATALSAKAHRHSDKPDLELLNLSVSSFRKAVELEPQWVWGYNNLGSALFSIGQWDEAITQFEKALAIDPKSSIAHDLWGTVLLTKAKRTSEPADRMLLKEAISHFEEALKLDSALMACYNRLGDALETQGDLEGAARQYTKAIEIDTRSIDSRIQLGKIRQKQSRFDDARTLFQSVIDFEPNHVVAVVSLGELCLHRVELQEAKRLLQRGVELDPKNRSAQNGLSIALMQLKEIDAGIAQCRKALEIDPLNSGAHNILGSLLLSRAIGPSKEVDKKLVAEAVSHIQKALELEPNNAWAHGNLGHALNLQGKTNEALMELKQSLQIDPAFIDGHRQLADLLMKIGRDDEGMAQYRKWIEVEPNTVEARILLGRALNGKLQFDEATQHLRKALEFNPGSTWGHDLLIDALFRQKRFDDALPICKSRADLEPENFRGPLQWGKALAGLDRNEEAQEKFEKVQSLSPKNGSAFHEIGNFYFGQNKLPEAVVWFQKEIEVDPKNSGAYNRLGQVLDRLGKADQAAAMYQKSIETNPGNTWALIHLGNSMLSQSKFEEAAELYRRSIEVDSQNAAAHTNLGLVLLAQDKPREAMTHSRDAIAVDAKFPSAHLTLGKALLDLGQWSEAIEEFDLTASLSPKNALYFNEMAWALVTQSGREEIILKRASEFANRAVEIDSSKSSYWNTLGVAEYRLGNWKLAIENLQKSMDLSQGGDGVDWVFLAMAHWQLEDHAMARQWLEKADADRKERTPQNKELEQFCQEARLLLKD